MHYHIIIPARLHATRFDRKLLQPLAGKAVLQHVYERALASNACNVTIAVDSLELRDFAQQIKANYCMTSTKHATGTDRLAEAAIKLQLPMDDIIVNWQGDEPFLPVKLIEILVHNLQNNPTADVATLACQLQNKQELYDPNIVKVIIDSTNYALAFSRKPISCYRHLGIYAYRVSALCKFSVWRQPIIERLERLEQLRFLWHGCKILAIKTHEKLPPGIDTPEDLIQANKWLQCHNII